MLKDGDPVDAATLHQTMPEEGTTILIRESQAECHSSANFPYWREIIVEAAEKSRLQKATLKFLADLPAANGDLRAHISALENALAKPIGNESRTLLPKDCAAALTNSLEARFNLKGARSGLETGLTYLDRLTDGLQFGEITVLGARPSVGKTALACNITARICLRDKVPTLFLSLEMSAAALCRRLLSCHESLHMSDLKSGRLSQDDFVKMAAFDRTLKNSPIYIRESFGGMSGGEAAGLIRRGAARKGVRLVVLDYLQKLKPDAKHEKRTYEVADASASLVNAVRESGVALLCLAQLNRESEREKGRTPRISDLADSGQIERDADTVLLLHRDKQHPEVAQLIVGKQRDGETGIVHLFFKGQFCRFADATNQPEPDDQQVRNPTND
jgi:replicative DNA helicase